MNGNLSSVFRVIQGNVNISGTDGKIAEVNENGQLSTEANINNISDITGQKDSADSLPVVLSNEQELILKQLDAKPNKVIYDEVLSTGIGSIDIVNYNVPLGFINELYEINVSGENVADYDIKINNQIVAKVRSYYTNYNTGLSLGGLKINESDNLKICVNNRVASNSFFNASVTYREL